MNRDSCFINEEELNVYLDGELRGPRKDALERHLQLCRSCSLRYEVALELKLKLREAIRAGVAPNWLKEKIRTQLAEESRIGRRTAWGFLMEFFKARPLVPVAAAGVLVVALLAVVFMKPIRPEHVPMVADMVQTHNEYCQGFPDEAIRSDSLEEVTRWIAASAGIEFAFSRSHGLSSPYTANVNMENGDTVASIGLDYQGKKATLFMIKGTDEELFGPKNLMVHNVPVYCGKLTDVNYALWCGGEYDCVLVSDLPEEKLLDLVDRII